MESVELINDFCLDSIQFSCLAIHLNYEFRFNAFLTQPFFSACQKGLSFWIRKIHKNVWKVSHTPKERNSLDNKSCQRKTCLSGLTHDLSFHGIHCIQSLSDVSMDKKDFFLLPKKNTNMRCIFLIVNYFTLSSSKETYYDGILSFLHSGLFNKHCQWQN